MCHMIDGEWIREPFQPATTKGRFVRADSQFRRWVEPAPGAEFPTEAGRYHLYVSLACPWAHRTLIVRKLKGLEAIIGVTVVEPYMGDEGWIIDRGRPGNQGPEPCVYALHQLYRLSDPHYSGIVTVPVLWDARSHTIVNNESSEIIRMFNDAFDTFGNTDVDLYPAELRDEIDETNAFVYERINNGVYRAGFAKSQHAYDEAVTQLFSALDELEERLSRRRYLAGDRITEADWRLFTTLVRFDAVYHGHFKCNLRRLVDYPNLWGFTRELYQIPGIAETVDFDQIKRHYYGCHRSINPTGIVPKGPLTDFSEPHDRERRPPRRR